MLWRAGHFAPDARLKSRLPRQLAATAMMALILSAGSRFAEPFLAVHGVRYVALAALIALGLGRLWRRRADFGGRTPRRP